ncbi:MAG: hypothetical protein ACRDHW_04270, partial [Ktedonobacteraceae bacterium]
ARTGRNRDKRMSGRQHSIVPHRANYFFIPLEDDYLAMYEDLAAELDPIKERNEKKLSGSSDCKAMIASVLEAWMNSKRPTAKCDDDLFVYYTYDEWEQALRYRYKRSTIIQCLKEMEDEGEWTDSEGTLYQGTIKKRHFVQNTYEYQLNLPVIMALLEKLPEQSPFEQKARPSLGRPRKNRVNKNRSEINGLNSDDRSVKIDGQSVKINAPFYTQTSHTTQTDTEETYAPSQLTNDSDSAFASSPHAPSSSEQEIDFVEARDYLRSLGYKLEPTPQAYRCEEPGKALWSVTLPGYPNGFETWTTTEIKQHAQRLKSLPQETAPAQQFSTGAASSPQSAKVEPGAPPQEESPTKPASTGKDKGRTSSKPSPPEFSEDWQKVYDAWCANFKAKPRTGPETIKCANALYDRLMPWCHELKMPCKDLLKEIKGWVFSSDPDWYRPKGVTLCDIDSRFERWQSAKTEELEQANAKKQATGSAHQDRTIPGFNRWVPPGSTFTGASSPTGGH